MQLTAFGARERNAFALIAGRAARRQLMRRPVGRASTFHGWERLCPGSCRSQAGLLPCPHPLDLRNGRCDETQYEYNMP